MALAASLIKGFKYEVAQGILAGEVVTIVDNTTFPDGHVNARKITVKFSDGGIDYVLPRLISDVPVGIENPALVSIDAPVPAVPTAPVALELADEPVTVEVAPGVTADYRTLRPITDPMDARLDHLRPSKAKVKKYIKRIMKNGMSDVDFLLTFTNDDHRADNELRPANVMLKGDTQSGKTFMVEVLAVMWAERLGLPKPMPIFTLSGSAGVTDFDLFGQTTSYTDPNTGQESLVWLPGVVDMAAQCGGILYLDEVNAMAERVTSSLHPLADHRHQFINRNKPVYRHGQFMPEVVKGHDDLWIIGTYNEGYAGMGKMNEAFQNRFRHIRWDYDEAVESKLVNSPTVLFLGKALREARKANSRGVRTPVGTAALVRLARDIESFGVELALEVFVGMFQPGETDVVEAIIEDRSVIMLLNEEVEQRAREAAPAFEVVGGSEDAQALLDMLGPYHLDLLGVVGGSATNNPYTDTMITATAESPSRAHTSFVLSWGMFAIPVGVYTGTEKTAVVRKEYAEGNVARPVGRIAYDKTAVAADGTIKALDTTEVVRMAEASNGAWVELTDDEIADCTSPKGLGEIVTFVPVKDTGVYLAADLYQVRPKREKGKASPAAEKAFGLLLAAMAKRKVQALVKVALRGPARYALLDAEGNLTFVHTCDAVRRPIPLETPKVTPAEVNLAVALIDAVGIDTPVITDDTAAAVRTYVDAKAKGIPAPAKPAAPAIRDDIMATLEASIAASKKKVA